jgi:hypothetical protein
MPELSDGNAAEYYAKVQQLRHTADYHERRLIRYLRHEATGCGCRRDGLTGHTWAHVARLVAANLGSRQAAQGKWSRLIGPRRQAGDPVHGGRKSARP